VSATPLPSQQGVFSAAAPPRSQSVPVQLRRMSSAPPGMLTGGLGAVPILRWAPPPPAGGCGVSGQPALAQVPLQQQFPQQHYPPFGPQQPQQQHQQQQQQQHHQQQQQMQHMQLHSMQMQPLLQQQGMPLGTSMAPPAGHAFR
ncbi:unnamed protein product, partial [Polarella glacialis]